MAALSSRLLIVNPDPESIDWFAGVFSRDDTFLVSSREAAEAIELARTEPFDAAICDTTIEGGHDGLALVVELRRNLPKLPVIATSGSGAGATRTSPGSS